MNKNYVKPTIEEQNLHTISEETFLDLYSHTIGISPTDFMKKINVINKQIDKVRQLSFQRGVKSGTNVMGKIIEKYY